MMDFSLMLLRLDSMELQSVVCDVAQACAAHVYYKWYEDVGYDQPLFLKTFEHTYNATLKVHENRISDEEIPF